VYSGDKGTAAGVAGASYTNSWKISTYAHTAPETYTHRYFSERYGHPHRQALRDYLEQSGIRTFLQELKAEILTTIAEANGYPQALRAALVEGTELSQMFLTVQPRQGIMNEELDTYMQPHYDPSSLTINLHMSPLDFKGCLPHENGLLVLPRPTGPAPAPGAHPEQAAAKALGQVHPTPPGTVVFIWGGEGGEGCLHTGNDLTQGERVVLCTFWQQPQALRAQLQAAHGSSLAMRLAATAPLRLPHPCPAPAPPPLGLVPAGLASRCFQSQGYAVLDLRSGGEEGPTPGWLLGALAESVGLDDCKEEEDEEQAEEADEGGGSPWQMLDFLARALPLHEDHRTQLQGFRALRQALAAAAL
jgi:hypothetical protein